MRYLLIIFYVLFFIYAPESSYETAFFGSLIAGIGASRDARRLQRQADALNPVRPEYEIPQEMRDVVSQSQALAQADMPGIGRMINQAQGTTANQLSQARNFADSGTSLLQSLGIASESERRNMGDINMQNQQFRASNVNNFNRALMEMAGFRDQAFQFNEADPYFQQESDKRQFQAAAQAQRQAAREGWAAFGDGLVNTALTVGLAPMTAGGSMFSKIFNRPQPQRQQ